MAQKPMFPKLFSMIRGEYDEAIFAKLYVPCLEQPCRAKAAPCHKSCGVNLAQATQELGLVARRLKRCWHQIEVEVVGGVAVQVGRCFALAFTLSLALYFAFAARRLWRRSDLELDDEVVLDLLTEALQRQGPTLVGGRSPCTSPPNF